MKPTPLPTSPPTPLPTPVPSPVPSESTYPVFSISVKTDGSYFNKSVSVVLNIQGKVQGKTSIEIFESDPIQAFPNGFVDGSTYLELELGNFFTIFEEDVDLSENFTVNKVVFTATGDDPNHNLTLTDAIVTAEFEFITDYFSTIDTEGSLLTAGGSANFSYFTMFEYDVEFFNPLSFIVSENAIGFSALVYGNNATLTYIAFPNGTIGNFADRKRLLRKFGHHHPLLPPLDGNYNLNVTRAVYSEDATAAYPLCGADCRSRGGQFQTWDILFEISWDLDWVNLTEYVETIGYTFDLTAPGIQLLSAEENSDHRGITANFTVNEAGVYYVYANPVQNNYPEGELFQAGNFSNYANISVSESDANYSTVISVDVPLDEDGYLFPSLNAPLFSAFNVFFFAKDDGITDGKDFEDAEERAAVVSYISNSTSDDFTFTTEDDYYKNVNSWTYSTWLASATEVIIGGDLSDIMTLTCEGLDINETCATSEMGEPQEFVVNFTFPTLEVCPPCSFFSFPSGLFS